MKTQLSILMVALIFGMGMSSCKKDDTSNCIDNNAIDPNMACYEIYAPVCGCNDVTYSNDCYAEAAGVTSWTEGECQ